MADDNRLDLSCDLDKITSDLLSDVQAAAEEVKKRQADRKAGDASDAEKAKSRKMSLIVISASTVVLLLLAYWMVFARSETPVTNTAGTYGNSQPKSVQIISPGTTPSTARRTGRPAMGTPTGRSSQVVEHQSDDSSGDPGM